MSKHGFDIGRMCRLNGQSPTARERWYAFWRLYRVACHNKDPRTEGDLRDCFRVLFLGNRTYAKWVRLTGECVPAVGDRKHLPLFLRKRFLEMDRRKRLYGEHYEWMERDKKVAAQMRREDGIEVTPDEVAEVRRKTINLVRRKAAEFGVKVPTDDADLLRWIGKGMK